MAPYDPDSDAEEYYEALTVHVGRIIAKCPLTMQGLVSTGGMADAIGEIISGQYRTMLENARADDELASALADDETRRETIGELYSADVLDQVAGILICMEDGFSWEGARRLYDSDLDLIIDAVIINALEGLWLGTTD